jgi:hypothetical protein
VALITVEVSEIPPPFSVAVFPENLQLVAVQLVPLSISSPPPEAPEVLLMKEQLLSVIAELLIEDNPPALCVEIFS